MEHNFDCIYQYGDGPPNPCEKTNIGFYVSLWAIPSKSQKMMELSLYCVFYSINSFFFFFKPANFIVTKEKLNKYQWNSYGRDSL